MHGCQNYSLFVQRSTLSRVPDYEGKFLHFHWNILGMVVKTTAYVFRGAPWGRLSFFEIFQNCFRTLSDNRPDLWRKFSTALPKVHSACPKNFSLFFAVVCHVVFNIGFERKKILVLKIKFRQFCQICILNVGELFEEFFFKNNFSFNWVWILMQNVLNYQRKVSSRVVKTAFYVSSGPL